MLRIDAAIEPGIKVLSCVSVSFNGETIIFDVETRSGGKTKEGIRKSPDETAKTIFYYINEFYAQLPHEKQVALFECYKDATVVFQHVRQRTAIVEKITRIIQRIASLVSYEELLHWAIMFSGIEIPSELVEVLKEEDRKDAKMQRLTYTRREYVELMTYALALRMIFPIISEYLNNSGDESGSSFKDYIALNLLDDSWFSEHRVYLRLEDYVECLVGFKNPNLSSAILAGLSSEEIHKWVLASTITKSLSWIELSAFDNTASIVTKVYLYITKTVIPTIDRHFDGSIKPKKPEGESEADDDETKTSHAEAIKVVELVSTGVKATNNVYMDSIERIAFNIDPTIPIDLLHKCASIIPALQDMDIMEVHETMIKWILHTAIAPEAIYNLSGPSIQRGMVACQAALWHWGMLDLALLMCAQPGSDDVCTEVNTKLPNDRIDSLVALYPYYYPNEKREESEKVARVQNPALVAIDAQFKAIIQREWIRVGHPDLFIAKYGKVPPVKSQAAPYQVLTHLADLVIKLNEI